MAKWMLEDDCLAPERSLRIDYKGPDPFRLYRAIPTQLRAIFDVRGKDVWEREFRWDYSVDPREFFFRFIVKKGYDMWSAVYIEVVVQGKQPSDPNKDGEVYILLTSKLQTGFEETNPWNRSSLYKSIRWVYFKTIYNDIRRNLLQECRIKTNDLYEAIRKSLGIAPETVMS